MLVTTLYLLAVPLLVMLAAKKWPVIEKISPMVILYIIGLVVGNIGIVGEGARQTCTNVSNVVVLLSIPLMLLGCDFRAWSAKAAVKAFLVGLFSILAVTIGGFFLFHSQAVNAGISNTDFARVSAAMTGIYTGGIPNFAPVAKAVNLPDNLFLLVSGYDLVVTSLYLLFIVFLGGRLVRWLFPNQQSSPTPDSESDTSVTEEAASKSFWSRMGNRALGIGVAAIIVAASYELSLVIPIENSTAVIIILLTTLSIALSFWKPLKKLENTFDTGLYFVYVFCLAVATMVNIRELEFSRYIFILWYIAFAVFGSLLLQLLFAKFLKIDGDLTLTASISLINSPPFVPMVAAVLNNKSVILPGIAIGLLGYAVGNYLGIGIFMLLSALG
ncbi:MAG: DUF819 family protein [Bacteroidales bacterium]|nr:DUF819 family protein [Bacteroidales bacterium]